MTGADPSNRKIIVVDDSNTVRTWTKFVLEKAGYQVIASDNPVLVPNIVFKERPALLLLDVEMPLLDGDRLSEILKGGKYAPTIVLYSSKPKDELMELVESSGADGYMEKTSDPNDLIIQVNDWFTRLV